MDDWKYNIENITYEFDNGISLTICKGTIINEKEDVCYEKDCVSVEEIKDWLENKFKDIMK